MQKTDNYELNLPEAEDFFNIEDFNDNTKKIDEVLESLENPEHDTGKQAEVEELASGESLKVALRKLAKAVADYISHKADKVAHITATERTAWNAKLGVEKIAANLTTDTDGMVLAAAMGKNLKEQIDTNANAISTLNSNIDILQGKRKAKLYSTNSSATATFELADNVSYLLAITYAGMGTKYSALYYVDSGGYATVFAGSNISDIYTINIENKVLTITGKVYNFTSSLISLT